ncbi:MSMEG_0567/Sll0786 family nitrogen starvation N-acetyltransferase [Marinobacterium lutimaris]|uniref:Putative N-acetyltransferase, MSMEG_0567 N-terminal domain family n=1 Tax=Marinobacterium lutimaris TaxID=568106 RepID=A0A1H5VI13_9GAMM|nr:MSMEG_0567/Sll0786 family nitrogen starvation N-acetyltransferase [Marinobacterium lutimaris]SEF86853.1 putative N-acetyltransferase, MSMEG_0567 N-terminal domain family [Marinobacterium lutimaris]
MTSKNRHPAYSEYTIKWASLDWEANEAYALRRRVFCDEQSLFEQDDRDLTDQSAQLLVALGGHGGWHEQVVGTVRIHEEEPGIWYGSRLAVDPAFRTQGYLGATLIKLAVSSAHALGCRCFLARVQSQNETLFRRLHWARIGEESVRDLPHVIMQADLSHYPPCHTPFGGFVLRARNRRSTAEIAPGLLELTRALETEA